MLSYLHGFHAGNFADLHKHAILVALLEALNRKAKPWSYLETHSGRALYDLNDAQAQKTGEYQQGIGRLWAQPQAEVLEPYLQQVRRVNQGTLSHYPGSPTIAAGMARAEDRLRLMELHSTEVEALRQQFRQDERVAVHHRDGYEGVNALLPPTPKRGLVLIDPAYEVKTEYAPGGAFSEQGLPALAKRDLRGLVSAAGGQSLAGDGAGGGRGGAGPPVAQRIEGGR